MSQPHVFTLELSLEHPAVVSTLSSVDGEILASEKIPSDHLHKVRSQVNGPLAVPGNSIEALGREIGGIACCGAVQDVLVRAILASPIRLRLRVSDELSDVPWELMWLVEAGFVSQHPSVRFSREAGKVSAAPSTAKSIKILVVTADPGSPDYPPLAGLQAELASVQSALRAPECRTVRIDLLENATPNLLRKKLSNARYDVLHFLGHGDMRPSGGILVLEGHRPHEAAEIYGDEAASMLRESGVQLAVLSGCVTNGYSSSIGTQLVSAGTPAVVGMQLHIDDSDAGLFARVFYGALASGLSLDDAAYQGRMALRGSGPAWVSPVLTTSNPEMTIVRDHDGQVLGRGNLPKPLTSFIGRKNEIREVCEVLQTERLVVLLGSGGIGKTRLSIEVGRACASQFAKGVWQVLLDPVTDPAGVIDAIARVFGIRDASQKSIEERLFEFLSSQQLLLILDNCEQVVGACRDVALRVLTECPDVKILATSREVLGTGAEHVVRVPSLPYPSVPREEVPVYPVDETVASHEALQLLSIRAKAANSSFVVSEKNIEALCRIAQRLDGIPLALELAASRMLMYTPQQVLDRLLKNLSWLDEENPGKVPRHKTLRATIDWSYRLLTDEEKSLFNRLGVFAGTFSLEAAEAVCSPAPLDQDRIPDLLRSLIDKSLVVPEEHEFEMRYRLLDSCRQFALDELKTSGESSAIRERQLDYIASLATKLFDRKKSGQQIEWQNIMAAEHDNVVAAIDWALGEGGRPEIAAHIALDAIWYWLTVGMVRDVHTTIDRILSKLDDNDGELKVKLTLQKGFTRVVLGDPSGITIIKEARKIAQANHPAISRYATHLLANSAYNIGDDDLAQSLFLEIISESEQLGDPLAEGFVRLPLAYIEISRGNLKAAKDQLVKMIRSKRELRDTRGEGLASCALGYVEWLLKDGSAQQSFCDGLRCLVSVADMPGLGSNLVLASAVLNEVSPSRAGSVQGLAQRLAEDSGYASERHLSDWSKEIIEKTKRVLGDRYDSCHTNGRTMTVEEAIGLLSAEVVAP